MAKELLRQCQITKDFSKVKTGFTSLLIRSMASYCAQCFVQSIFGRIGMVFSLKRLIHDA